MDNLLIVTTGGTIDKIYFDDKSDYQIGDPQIGMILRELGVTFRFSVIPIPVSYTHLDVYKRQAMAVACTRTSALRSTNRSVSNNTTAMANTPMMIKSTLRCD